MIEYALSEMILRASRQRRKADRIIPRIQPSLRFELAYLALLRRIISTAHAEINAEVLPAYKATPKLIGDAAVDLSGFVAVLSGTVDAVAAKFRQLLSVTASEHTSKWVANAKSAFGVDLRGIVATEDLADLMDSSIEANVALIKDIGEEIQKRTRVSVAEAYLNGTSAKDLSEQLYDDLGKSDRRAKLVARDQAGKINSDMTRIRHLQAGVDEYIWRTSHDERVRKRHQLLDGKRYKYGEPTGAEGGLPPGKPVQCRCVARGVVSFD